jgi:hypothetical protein
MIALERAFVKRGKLNCQEAKLPDCLMGFWSGS